MTQTFSLLGFVAHLHAVERDMNSLGPAIVARACEMVAAEAKRVIGVGYDTWPQLASSTLGKKFYNTPLLETGEMRNSIEWQAHGLHGEVGSNLDKAVWHELGTSRIPPSRTERSMQRWPACAKISMLNFARSFRRHRRPILPLVSVASLQRFKNDGMSLRLAAQRRAFQTEEGMTSVDILANEIAGAVLACLAPGVIPSHALLLREFTNAYELFRVSPSEDDHQRICDRVRALIF
jgi:hypothetical protein